MDNHIDIEERKNNGKKLTDIEEAYLKICEYYAESLIKAERLTQSLADAHNNLIRLIRKEVPDSKYQEGEEGPCINCAIIQTIFNSAQEIKDFEYEQTITSFHCINEVKNILSPHH